jgi:hypothetical protein
MRAGAFLGPYMDFTMKHYSFVKAGHITASKHDRATREHASLWPPMGHQDEGVMIQPRVGLSSYRAALELWCGGTRDVLFPVGTWWMCVFHCAGVNSAALPT